MIQTSAAPEFVVIARLLLVVFTVASLGLTACSDTSGQADAGPVDVDSGTETDGGDGGDEVVDDKCRDDKACPANQYCERSSGECTDAKACTSNDDCAYQWPGKSDYCDFGGCFCDTERNNGTCRPRFLLCGACERDVECGDDDWTYDDYVATCQDLGGTKVCLPALRGAPCPPAYVANSSGTFCEPAGGSCPPQAPCARDTDCDPMSDTPICNIDRGFCVEACEFDFASSKSDCPPNQICHVDPRLLKANNPNFGAGKCGAPCDSGTNPTVCAATTSCVVDGDPVMSTAEAMRCRPTPPKCIRNADCPQSPATNSNGYCDLGTLDCATGCQRESDCFDGYKCVENACVEKTCIENGGANLACGVGQFCCGEENSVAPCPTGVQTGKCYDAPNPPWCATCTTVGPVPASTPGGTRIQDSQCVLADGATHLNGQPTSSPKILFHSCDPEADPKKAACPRSWQCMKFGQFCDTDADCGPNGACDVKMSGAEGTGEFKVCGCNDGKTCPGNSTCMQPEGSDVAYCEATWCDNLSTCLAPPPEDPAP